MALLLFPEAETEEGRKEAEPVPLLGELVFLLPPIPSSDSFPPKLVMNVIFSGEFDLDLDFDLDSEREEDRLIVASLSSVVGAAA